FYTLSLRAALPILNPSWSEPYLPKNNPTGCASNFFDHEGTSLSSSPTRLCVVDSLLLSK
ncbi:MAG: hypothetical protein AB8B56_01290, partial [Crocinitomicaceae bacterium]